MAALPEPGEGDVVLACGMKALEKLRAAGLVHKSRTLDLLREKPVKRGQGWLMLTFDPGVIQSQPEKREIIDWDVRLAHRLMTTGIAGAAGRRLPVGVQLTRQ